MHKRPLILCFLLFSCSLLVAQNKKKLAFFNTALTENAPSVSADKEFFIFESNICDPSNLPDPTNTSNDLYNCIWEGKRHPTGEYPSPMAIDNINSFFKTTRIIKHPTISYDGNMIWLAGRNSAGKLANDDIFFSVRTKDGWGVPQNAGEIINSPLNEVSPCLSADGRKLYFAREEATNTVGSSCFKIYVATRKNVNATWENVVQLSYAINQGCSYAPRIHADGKTLFFSSKRNDREDYDLYQSTLQEGGIWSEAKPLKFVNTRKDELFASVNPCGDKMYYAHDNDLYETTLPEEFRPQKCITVQGYVLDSASQTSINAAVWVKYKADSTDVKTIYTSFNSLNQEGNDHRFSALIPTSLNNECEIELRNKLYFPKTLSISPEDFSTCAVVSKEASLPLVPVPIQAQSHTATMATKKKESKDFRKQ